MKSAQDGLDTRGFSRVYRGQRRREALANTFSFIGGVIAVGWLISTGSTRADADLLPVGYSIKLISSNVTASQISQLAFQPGDPNHVFAARNTRGVVTRYDYDPVTGQLSGEQDVVTIADQKEVVGLAFHGVDLYISLDYGGTTFGRPGDGRIARFRNPDSNGVYQVRHDFVHSIDKGAHDVNQLQILGDALFVGIGAAGRKGIPAEETIYTMSIGRIGDLKQVVTEPGEIGPDFKGPTNYLAATDEWLEVTTRDAKLRLFASGFRNPYGIRLDPEGELWVSENGNNDAGFISHDWLYKKVQAGDRGGFPPESFGFSNLVTGRLITPFVDFGVSPSPTGFDFIQSGRDAGKVLMVEAGASRTNWLGRDLLLIDGTTAEVQQIYRFATNSIMTDIVADPFGRFLISDYTLGKVWLLTPPQISPRLSVVITNGHLEITWPLTAVDYRLEETFVLGPGAVWLPSPIEPPAANFLCQVKTSITNTTRYFRIRRSAP